MVRLSDKYKTIVANEIRGIHQDAVIIEDLQEQTLSIMYCMATIISFGQGSKRNDDDNEVVLNVNGWEKLAQMHKSWSQSL